MQCLGNRANVEGEGFSSLRIKEEKKSNPFNVTSDIYSSNSSNFFSKALAGTSGNDIK